MWLPEARSARKFISYRECRIWSSVYYLLLARGLLGCLLSFTL